MEGGQGGRLKSRGDLTEGGSSPFTLPIPVFFG